MYKREWTEELAKKAKDELNETPKKRRECLKLIKEWLSKESYLNARRDDEVILNYLRGSKFDVEKTKEKLEFFCRTKLAVPEFFSNRDPLLPELQTVLKRCILVPHSTKHEEMLFVRWANTDVNEVSLVNLFKVAFMLIDVGLIESSSYLIMGYHIVIDFENFPLSYIKQVSPSLLKKVAYTLTKAYPVRIKGIYIFNTFPFFSTLFNMFGLFLSKKILSRVKIYDTYDVTELSKYINIENIPKEYEGKSESLYDIAAHFQAAVESQRKWFLKDEKYELADYPK